MEISVKALLSRIFGASSCSFRNAGGQGNHITYLVEIRGLTYFLRMEDGPEEDSYMEIEAKVLDLVRDSGVPTPIVYAVDATRREYPFSYQLMQFIDYPDLNSLYKKEPFEINQLGVQIGYHIALWQKIQPEGFGFFDPQKLSENSFLAGLHSTYRDYFLLNWERHLDFLIERQFIDGKVYGEIKALVHAYDGRLDLPQGVMVHKDLALWNILGTRSAVKSYIDWDDAISGDPTDDISLLACFHSGAFITHVLEGYQQVRELPEDFTSRFWLHLLRNMIVKAVIRVGAGYFDLNHDFFLIGTGDTGESLKHFTRERIQKACLGLQNKLAIQDL